MKYFSMFTGVGGFELGIERAYENLIKKQQRRALDDGRASGHKDEHAPLPACVGFSEIDPYASQLLQVKWPKVRNYGDATKIDEKSLPDFDLLVGGFPCQSFSISGKRGGFNDTRGTLFFDIARILAYKKPKHFLLENVKGILSHDGGRTFSTIIGVLTDLGYLVEWQVLNSKNFEVPQNRERIYLVGYLGTKSRPKVFPITEDSRSHIEEITRGVSDAQRIYTPRLAKTLKSLGGGLGAKTGLYDVSYTIDANYYKGINTGSMGGRSSFEKMKRQTVGIFPNVRRLTPMECERLQGFPDLWTKVKCLIGKKRSLFVKRHLRHRK